MIQGVLVSDLTQSCEDGTLELELETLCRHNSHGDGSVDTLYTEAKWKLLYSATARDGDCLGLGWNKISGYLHRYCRYILFVC